MRYAQSFTQSAGMGQPRYIRATLMLGIAVPLALVFSVNALVDPFSIWGTRISGINEVKLPRKERERLYKPYQVRRYAPTVIAHGSSRTLVGIDPSSSVWPSGRVYNLGLLAPTIAEIAAYYRHAEEVNHVDTLVLGLDFFYFNADKAPNGTYDPRLLRSADRRLGWQLRRLQLTLSPVTLAESIDVVRLRAAEPAPATFEQGFLDLAYVHAQRGDVQQSLRERNENSLDLSGWFYFDMETRGFHLEAEDGYSTIGEFADLLRYCREHGTAVKLFVSPAHAAQWESLDALGLWPLFEHWKRELAHANELVAAEYEDDPFPFWDFSGYNAINSEPLPDVEDGSDTSSYFHDLSHYKPIVGDMILGTLFSGLAPADFGVTLSPGIMDSSLKSIRSGMADWRARHPEYSEAVRARALAARPLNARVQLVPESQ